MKDSEFLRRARELLAKTECGHNSGLCMAIRAIRVTHETATTEKQMKSLLEWVEVSLEGRLWVQCWLLSKIGPKRYWAEFSLEKLRETRLAWLDWMIMECEKNENKTN